MKSKFHLLCVPAIIALSSCATSSSDVRLADMPSGQGVLFGHVDIYNGDDKLDGGSLTNRCWLAFSNAQGDQVAKVKTDETGWIFASVPVGKTYLSHVLCNAGFLKSHPEVETRDLSFEIPQEKSAAYFGDVTLRFNYHGVGVAGMFGLVGAVTQVASESGTNGAAQTQVNGRFDAAKQEFQNRFGPDYGSFKVFDSTIVLNLPAPAPSP